MGYQNVGTPRFYISRSEYLLSLGQDVARWNAGQWGGYDSGGGNGHGEKHISNILRMNPHVPNYLYYYSTDVGSGEADIWTYFPDHDAWDINFVAILNHNLATQGQPLHFLSASGGTEYGMGHTEIVNFPTGTYDHSSSIPAPPVLDGFSIVEVDRGESPYHEEFRYYLHGIEPHPNHDAIHFGSIFFGRYYDMPHSPDLSLKMTHEFDGIKTVTTKGGGTLSSLNYHKTPDWEGREAWQLGNFPYYYSGRRVWDLSFSYISDSDIEPYSYYGNKYASDTDTSSPSQTPGGDNWFQNVLYFTQGGHLPFLFCPDPNIVYYYDGTNPPRVPEFAICRFDMNSFQREQVANNVYNIKLKIVESW